jgi:iron complex transport system ATP-binding protein
MIRFESVTVRYPRADRDAVHELSFAANDGALTAVVGPNGSGKSTLVRALLGRVPTAGGRVMVAGDDASTLDRRELARRVAVVTQREETTFPIPVWDYVALGRRPYGGRWSGTSRVDHDVVSRAMTDAGVAALESRDTSTLSGGEWQRARIARALAQDAATLVLDEPSTFLDVAHEMAIFELLHALARRARAVLVVSHQLNLVARFADHVVLLHHGRLAAAGAPADVMQGAVLERVYEWPLVVARDPAVGAPSLIPLRRSHPPAPPAGGA